MNESDINTVHAKVLARVRKLMALASNAGATEGERDNAMRMAHATLAKYNLSMAQAEANGEEAVERRGRMGKQFLGKPWCSTIAGAIADLYFCYYYRQRMSGNGGPAQPANHVFVGREANAITASEMSKFLVEAVNAEAGRWSRACQGGYKAYRAFAQSAAIRIHERCVKLRAEADKAAAGDDLPVATTGTAIVLASVYKKELEQNEAYLKAKGVELGTMRRQSIDLSQLDSHAVGRAYGDKVSLNKQVEGAKVVDSSKRLGR